MTTKAFFTDLWYRDLRKLPASHQDVATAILIFASLELHCRPYHRASKFDAPSDRQTIFKHPATGHVCFVLSVVPTKGDAHAFVLRLDFFDKTEVLPISLATVQRAPNSQWTEKGERRFVVPQGVSLDDLRPILRAIVDLDR